MTNKPAVFYFEFGLEDDTVKYFGFAVSPEGAAHLADAEDNPCIEYFGLEDLEFDYGVHDWCTSPDDRVIATGYGSGEIKEADIPKVMEIWREAYVQKCGRDAVTPVVELPLTVEQAMRMNDHDFYRAVIAAVEAQDDIN